MLRRPLNYTSLGVADKIKIKHLPFINKNFKAIQLGLPVILC